MAWTTLPTILSLSLAARVLMVVLAIGILHTSFTGRAGVQVLDHVTAARIAPLHLHGVAGEAAYVHEYHAPAPFVAPHCHADPTVAGNPPGPESAAAALAGSVLCAAANFQPVAASAALSLHAAVVTAPAGLSMRPPVPPPLV